MKGFTLVEMAVVLIVLGLLLSALAAPLAVQIEVSRIRETRVSLREIREALIGFALANGRLPCPADPTLSKDAGRESIINGQCARSGGVLPWVDLGVKELDAWGSRYSYQVATELADASALTVGGCSVSAPAGVSFSLCSSGDIFLSDGANLTAVNIPAVIVSHGPNRHGAYDSRGQQLANAQGDEAENSNFDSLLVNHLPVEEAGEVIYDDLIEWVPMPLLTARMVTAGRLP